MNIINTIYIFSSILLLFCAFNAVTAISSPSSTIEPDTPTSTTFLPILIKSYIFINFTDITDPYYKCSPFYVGKWGIKIGYKYRTNVYDLLHNIDFDNYETYFERLTNVFIPSYIYQLKMVCPINELLNFKLNDSHIDIYGDEVASVILATILVQRIN